MKINAGKLLVATNQMDDEIFKNSIVFVAEVNENGALGLVVNKRYGRCLSDLAEFFAAPPLPLYAGGPVAIEHLYFLHRNPELIAGGTHAENGIFYGGDFKQAIAHLKLGKLAESDIKICVGYCGWDAGELEAEIEEGSWTLKDAEADEVFKKW